MAIDDFKNLKNYLDSFGAEVVENAKSNLKAKDKGGGKLEKSIDFKVVPEGNGFVVQFFMEDYGTFVDKGVKGAGGTIKSGKHKGSWGGRRHFVNWKGKRQDSPYKFGSGKGKKNGIYKGIDSFIRKKGLQPRSKGGQYMSTKSLIFMFSRSVYIRGIHGVSFFQKPLGLWYDKLQDDFLKIFKQDIHTYITTFYTPK